VCQNPLAGKAAADFKPRPVGDAPRDQTRSHPEGRKARQPVGAAAVKIELLISLRTAESLGLTFGPFGNGAPTAFQLSSPFPGNSSTRTLSCITTISAATTRARALSSE